MERIKLKVEKATIKISLIGKHWNRTGLIWRNGKGFSLLELILVIFLIGLIAGLVTPFLSSTLERTKGQSEVRKMASTLRYARGQAVSQKTPFIFKASIDAKQYRVVEATTNDISGKTVDLGWETNFTRFTNQNETQTNGEFAIVFYPQGNSSGGSIDLQITASGKPGPQFSITVDQVTGKPHVEERTQSQ